MVAASDGTSDAAMTTPTKKLVIMNSTHKLSLEEKLERARQRRGTAAAPPTAPPAPASLPSWPDAVRAVPNGFLRSALFGAIAKGRRRYLERELIATVEDVEIRYTGQRLDQGDLDVWATALHVARAQALGNECRVTAYQLLKLLGKTNAGTNRETLDKRLSRMKATGLDVKVGRFSYEGSLIDEVYRDEVTREYVIRLNHKISILFSGDQFTQLDWAIRHALEGQQLAQWLHGFYASHAQPYPIKVETLLKLAGSENENPRSAQQKLRKALEAVTEASTAHGQPFSHQVIGDLVQVEKKPSGSQRRHLARKGKR